LLRKHTAYQDYKIVDHLIWHYERFETDALTALDVQLGTPVQDSCALKKWKALMKSRTLMFFFRGS
jgi:hypothetical protein